MGDEGNSSQTGFHLWMEGGRVLAAACTKPDGYYWCQSWDAPDLLTAALDAAASWGLSPDSPPAVDDSMWPLSWLRAVIPLGTRGERVDRLMTEADAPLKGLDLYVRQLVCSGLPSTRRLTTLSWPSLEVDTAKGQPDPETAALVLQRLSDRKLREAESEAKFAARRQADEPRRERKALAVQVAAQATKATALAQAAAAQAAADAALVAEREVVIASWAEVALSKGAFVAAVADGASYWHLRSWADTLLDAVLQAGEPEADEGFGELGHLLREVVLLRRNQLDPFAGYLEAPPSIIALRGAHMAGIDELTHRRDEMFAGLLTDTASALHGALGRPLEWSELLSVGAWPVPPPAPEPEEWEW